MFAMAGILPGHDNLDCMTVHPTVAMLLAEGVQRLKSSSAGAEPGANPALDAQLLLAHALGIERTRLKSHPEARADAGQARRFRDLLGRRAADEPLAYLTGWREFWSLRLSTSPAVLVPRPESELLVERALALHPADTARVADLGTGSGALALALASERPRWRIVATDVSAPALELARANADRLGLALDLRHGSWFEPLAGERFDLILSNPPYVAAHDAVMASGPLSHEPRAALSPGADALECLRILAQGAPRYLSRGGWLLLEHGATQAAQVRNELVLARFAHVRSHRDLAGHERTTEGQYDQI
jgi:release factor glutamine methyltransferase